jgi:hypothetical protein
MIQWHSQLWSTMGLPLACHLAVEDNIDTAQRVKSMIAATKRRLRISVPKTGVQRQRSRRMSTPHKEDDEEGTEISCQNGE